MTRVPKQRADLLLVALGLAESRAKAQALILAGKVFTDAKRVEKAGDLLPEGLPIEVRGQDHPWVSRGGLKLAHALTHFGLNPEGRICIDLGASTGGFTDVLLQHGAARVYAVDVGHGQLAWKLRQDPRVQVLEKTNARYLDASMIPEPISALVCDASFIGLRTILPAPLTLCAPGAFAVALIKPQFEVGKGLVGKGGIVRDHHLHEMVIADIESWLITEMGWQHLGTAASPIDGPDGNREFLLAGKKPDKAR